MKKIILLSALFFSIFSFSQRDLGPKELPANEPIELVDGKYLVNGEQFSNYDVKFHLKNNNTEAYNFYKKSKSKSSVGGLLLGLGSGLIVSDAIRLLTIEGAKPGGFSIAGFGLLGVSIPVLHGRDKILKKSISTYNDGLTKEKTLGDNFDVNILASVNGVGLTITF